MTLEEVYRSFETEFAPHRSKFSVVALSLHDEKHKNNAAIFRPGVYVWWHPNEGVLKVGRHLTNAYKRALEHIRDNTGQGMKHFGGDPSTQLLLFTVPRDDDKHWVAALEIFLETRARPKIHADRLG